MAVPAVVDHVPEDVRLAHQIAVREERLRVGRQFDAQDLRAARRRYLEARGLPVAEDAAVVVGGPRSDTDRLGEEHRALAVVAGGVVHELHRHVLLVVEHRTLERVDEPGPRSADDQRLEPRVGRAVGRVHGEDHEVLDAVDAVLLGPEQRERRGEVRLAASAADPGTQVTLHLREVVLLVREERPQLADGVDHGVDAGADLFAIVLRQVDLSLGLLQRTQRIGLIAQAQPSRMRRRLGDDPLGRRAEGGQRRPVDHVEP